MMQVMIADDNIIHRKKIRQMLESMGHDVVDEAKNGLHTYHKFVECKPDLLLMNINMPLYDGISTLERIVTFDPRASVVVMAHEDQNQLLFEAMEKGAMHYMKFPFEANQFKRLFHEIEILKQRRTNV